MKTKLRGILTLLLAFVVQISFAQDRTVSGTVTDGDGIPLPGVNIALFEAQASGVRTPISGTQTDFDGRYTITANSGQVLEFSFIGYETQQRVVGTSATVNVTMAVDA